MKIGFTKIASKNFHRLPKRYQDSVKKRLAKLAEDSFSPELDIKPFQEKYPNSYRLRIGPIRAVYYIEGNVITVYAIGFRGDVYK